MSTSNVDHKELLPKTVEELDFQSILNRKKAKLQELQPQAYGELIPSDPAITLLEVSSYSEGLLRNRLNEGLLAVSIQYATGSDLDNLGLLWGIERKIIKKADNTKVPPSKAIYETDSDLRQRILEAPKGFSVAGPRSSYIYYGKLADDNVKDISAQSTTPGVITIKVLSYIDNGTSGDDLLQKVTAKLNDEDIRPLGDKVEVSSAEIVEYEVVVELEIDPTPNLPLILENAKVKLEEYTKMEHKIGGIVALSGIYSACHSAGSGIERVVLKSPLADIVTTTAQAPYCTKITVKQYEGDLKASIVNASIVKPSKNQGDLHG